MAKLVDLLPEGLPATFVSEMIWDKVGRPPRTPKKRAYSPKRGESTHEIFAAGQTLPCRRKRFTHTAGTGSIVVGVRTGAYTTCVCKHKM